MARVHDRPCSAAKAALDHILERVRDRGREYERRVDPAYLAALRDASGRRHEQLGSRQRTVTPPVMAPWRTPHISPSRAEAGADVAGFEDSARRSRVARTPVSLTSVAAATEQSARSAPHGGWGLLGRPGWRGTARALPVPKQLSS